MPITISGDGTIAGIATGGYPAATVNVEDLNAGTASAGQVLVAGGATGAMTFGSSIVLGTPQNSTSGTAIDFTGIPSWARRVTVMFNEVSTNGTSTPLVQLGAGSIAASGYVATGGEFNGLNITATASSSAGFIIRSAAAANAISGFMRLELVGSNTWTSSHTLKTTSASIATGAGAIALSGTLDRVRITTVNGTDTFDAGSINITWE